MCVKRADGSVIFSKDFTLIEEADGLGCWVKFGKCPIALDVCCWALFTWVLRQTLLGGQFDIETIGFANHTFGLQIGERKEKHT